MSTDLYYLASLIKTEKREPNICFWRPNNAGYAWPLSWSGKYTAEQVRSDLGYYHNGDRTIAVKVEAVDAIARPPKPGTVDGDAGPVVLNTKLNWEVLFSAMIEPPAIKPVLYAGEARRVRKGPHA